MRSEVCDLQKRSESVWAFFIGLIHSALVPKDLRSQVPLGALIGVCGVRGGVVRLCRVKSGVARFVSSEEWCRGVVSSEEWCREVCAE